MNLRDFRRWGRNITLASVGNAGLMLALAAPIVIALILVQNYSASGIETAPGLNIFELDDKTTSTLDSKAEFDSGDYTNESFETGADDLKAFTSADDSLRLNHYGDNAPDVSVNTWYDDDSDDSTLYDWRYRRCFAVNNNGADSLSEYHVYLDINTKSLIDDGKMNVDGDDIRFVDINGMELDYYIADGINTDSTRIWIKTDTLPTGSNDDICMYYGHSGTPMAKSDRGATFIYDSPRGIYHIVADTADSNIAEFASYGDDNDILFDSDPYNLDQFEFDSYPSTLSLTQDLGISTTGPLSGTYNANATDNLITVSAAGTEFVYRMDRYTNEFSILSPWCTAVVAMENEFGNAINGSPFTITAGSFQNIATNNGNANGIPNNNSIIIEEQGGDCPILINHHANNGNDNFVMFPADTEWYGVGSSSAEIAALEDNTTLTVYRSDNLSQTFNIDRGGELFLTVGGGTQGNSPGRRIVADKPIGVKSINDGAGNEAATFLPLDQMGYEYYVADESRYITVSTEAGLTTTVNLYNDATSCGVGAPDSSFTVNATGNFPGKVLFNGPIPAAACVTADNRISLYNDYDANDDEHNVWNYKQNRQFTHPEPTAAAGAAATGGPWTLGTATTFSDALTISISNNSASAINEYQIPIDLSTMPAAFHANTQADGGDIYVAGAVGDGSDNLSYWLEDYDQTAGSGTLWIQTESIAAASNQDYFVYFNAAAAISTAGNKISVFTTDNLYTNYYVVDEEPVDNGDTLSVIAFVDGTQVSDGTNTKTINEGQLASVPFSGPLATTTIVSSEKPVHVANSANTTDSAIPIGFAGLEFAGRAQRDTDSFSFYAPYQNAAVTIEQGDGTGWTALTTVNVPVGTEVTVTQDITNGRAFKITASQPVLAFHRNNGNDSKVLYPTEQTLEQDSGTYELYGVGTGSVLIAATGPGTTNVTLYRSNNTTASLTLNSGNFYSYVEGGGGSQGTARGYRIVADGPIAASSYADADGGETVSFWPRKEFSNQYVLSQPSQYFAIVTREPGVVCRVYDELGAEQTGSPAGMDNPPPQTGAALSSPYVNRIHIGGDDTGDGAFFQPGYRLECSAPVYAYYEHHNGSGISDESSWLSWPQHRQRAAVEPVVEDPDSAPEEGLYYESGFDMAGTGLISQSTATYTIDSGQTGTSWDSIALDYVDGAPQTNINGVDPIEIEYAYSNGPDCSTATYSTFVSLTVSANVSIPAAAEGQRCLRYRLTLNTGDPAYSPEIRLATTCYYSVTEMEGQLANPTITVDGNSFPSAVGATDSRRLLASFTLNDPSLSAQAFTAYAGSVNDGVFINADFDIVDMDSLVSVPQHDFPAFPTSSSDVNATASLPVDSTKTIGVYFDHSRLDSGGNAEIDLVIKADIGGPIISRQFKVIVTQ